MADKFIQRRNKVRKAFARHGINALLITDTVNIRYLTNFTGGSACLLIQRSGDVLLSDPRFTIQIAEECPNLEAVINPRNLAVSAVLAEQLGEKGGRLGIEAESVTLAQQERLFKDLPHWIAVPVSDITEKLRAVKDKDERRFVQQAVDIAAKSFKYIRQYIQQTPDADEIDVRNMLEFAMRLFGAEDKSFSSIVGAGARAALPHAVPGYQKIAGQSHLIIDWGCIVNGYMSDLTRVLIFDRKDKQLRKVYETVLKANEAAIAAIKPGKTCEEIDRAAAKVLVKSRFVTEPAHALGHSVGLEIHENPRFAKGDKTVLKPGMILTVEPGIYIRDWGGIRIEDDIIVTSTGCRVLSSAVPKRFADVCM
ncbi:MAG: Xaa-Pro peptidase family protein [Planctomycetaceae bacterium]|jgi:Xaa-Pro aminopeptidase|nr:Xaa-Pro peptidase family protein [Planctomycetaceae bacterium]